MMSHRARMLLIALTFLSAMIVLGGCGTQPASPQVTLPNNAPSEHGAPDNIAESAVPSIVSLTVYQVDKNANYLVAEVHKFEKDKLNGEPARAALELLLAGTKNPNLVNAMPKGTKLKGLVIKDHIAYVDFSQNLLKNHTGGSTQEIFTVGAIVNTLTEFPSIEKVQILVEGKKVVTIAGHVDVSEPLSRSEKIIKK